MSKPSTPSPAVDPLAISGRAVFLVRGSGEMAPYIAGCRITIKAGRVVGIEQLGLNVKKIPSLAEVKEFNLIEVTKSRAWDALREDI